MEETIFYPCVKTKECLEFCKRVLNIVKYDVSKSAVDLRTIQITDENLNGAFALFNSFFRTNTRKVTINQLNELTGFVDDRRDLHWLISVLFTYVNPKITRRSRVAYDKNKDLLTYENVRIFNNINHEEYRARSERVDKAIAEFDSGVNVTFVQIGDYTIEALNDITKKYARYVVTEDEDGVLDMNDMIVDIACLDEGDDFWAAIRANAHYYDPESGAAIHEIDLFADRAEKMKSWTSTKRVKVA